MQHRYTPSIAAKLQSSVGKIAEGPSLESICMLRLLARAYQPFASEEAGLNKHFLA